MEIIIRFNGEATLIRRETLDGSDWQGEPLREKSVVIQDVEVGCLVDTQISTDSFFLSHRNFQPNAEVELSQEVESDVVQLDFVLRGTYEVYWEGKSKGRRFESGQHNITYLPQSTNRVNYFASEWAVDHSVIIIPRAVYSRLLSPGSALHRQFEEYTEKGKATFYAAENPPITPAMAWLLRDIRNCPHAGCFKRLFLESRLTELLMLQLEQMQTGTRTSSDMSLEDDRKIREAQALLNERYSGPPTIAELARLVGLNEYKLKKGFKAQTNSTILGYVTQMRMEAAQRWLLVGEHTISEIAYRVGYKNPSHFTAAFKKYFGRLPSEAR